MLFVSRERGIKIYSIICISQLLLASVPIKNVEARVITKREIAANNEQQVSELTVPAASTTTTTTTIATNYDPDIVGNKTLNSAKSSEARSTESENVKILKLQAVNDFWEHSSMIESQKRTPSVTSVSPAQLQEENKPSIAGGGVKLNDQVTNNSSGLNSNTERVQSKSLEQHSPDHGNKLELEEQRENNSLRNNTQENIGNRTYNIDLLQSEEFGNSFDKSSNKNAINNPLLNVDKVVSSIQKISSTFYNNNEQEQKNVFKVAHKQDDIFTTTRGTTVPFRKKQDNEGLEHNVLEFGTTSNSEEILPFNTEKYLESGRNIASANILELRNNSVVKKYLTNNNEQDSQKPNTTFQNIDTLLFKKSGEEILVADRLNNDFVDTIASNKTVSAPLAKRAEDPISTTVLPVSMSSEKATSLGYDELMEEVNTSINFDFTSPLPHTEAPSLTKFKENVELGKRSPPFMSQLLRHSNEIGNEGRRNQLRSPSSEKRGKFINDNSTNVQQLNLPDVAEVWTLAGMKTMSQSNVAMTTDKATSSQHTTENIFNGSIVGSNNEKNILDWRQIMMNLDIAPHHNEAQQPPEYGNRTITETLIHSAFNGKNKISPTVTPLGPSILAGEEGDLVTIESSTLSSAGAILTLQQQETTPAMDVLTREQTSSILPILRLSVSRNSSKLASHPTHLSAADNVENDFESNHTQSATTSEPIIATTYSSPEIFTVETASSDMHTTPTVAVVLPQNNSISTDEMTLKTNINNNNNNGDRNEIDEHTAANATNVDVDGDGDGNDAATAAVAAAFFVVDNTKQDSHVSSSESTTLSSFEVSEENGSTTSLQRALFDIPRKSLETVEEETTVIPTNSPTSTTTTTTTIITSTTLLQNILATSTAPTSSATEVDQNNHVNVETKRKEQLKAQLGSDSNFSTIKAHFNSTSKSLESETTITTTPATTTTKERKTSSTSELLIKDRKEIQVIEATIPTESTLKKETFTTLSATTPAATTTTITIIESTTVVGPEVEETTQLEAKATPVDSVKGVSLHSISKSSAKSDVTVELDKRQNKIKSDAVVSELNALRETVEKAANTTEVTKDLEEIATKPTEKQEQDNKEEVKTSEETQEEEFEKNVAKTTAPTTNKPKMTAITTTMIPYPLNRTTNEEDILIGSLDDSTTTTTTTVVPTTVVPTTIATKVEPIYTIIVSTTTESIIDSTSTTSAVLPATEPNKIGITGTIVYTSSSQAPIVDDTTLDPRTKATSATMLPPSIMVQEVSTDGADMPSVPKSPTLGTIMGGNSGHLYPKGIEPAGETDVNVIIAITVSVIGVVAVILLVAFLYVMRKRQKQTSYSQRCRPVSLDAYSIDNTSIYNSMRTKGSALRSSKRSYGNVAFDDPSLHHNVLGVAELAKFIEQRSSIYQEFRDVPQIMARADEVPHGCEDKNRYANVVPFPETRVVLQQLNDDPRTEYINANYVRGPKDSPNYYIACQAPLETTVDDFWRMIWEQQSRVIIQATDLIENGVEKCAEYLPPSVTLDNHSSYGDFQVTLLNREVKDKYAISTILLKNTVEDASRELTHYWYKWPEAGVPGEEAPIIAMLLEARSSLISYAIEQNNELKEKLSTVTLRSTSEGPMNSVEISRTKEVNGDSLAPSNGEINGNVSTVQLKKAAKNQGPLTVHCSPGTGRTGTIIACDMAIRSLETPKRSIDIPQIVYYVRHGRASAVQTKEQYEFIYKVANMYATKITNASNDV